MYICTLEITFATQDHVMLRISGATRVCRLPTATATARRPRGPRHVRYTISLYTRLHYKNGFIIRVK